MGKIIGIDLGTTNSCVADISCGENSSPSIFTFSAVPIFLFLK